MIQYARGVRIVGTSVYEKEVKRLLDTLVVPNPVAKIILGAIATAKKEKNTDMSIMAYTAEDAQDHKTCNAVTEPANKDNAHPGRSKYYLGMHDVKDTKADERFTLSDSDGTA